MQDYIITTAKTDADIQGIARCAEESSARHI